MDNPENTRRNSVGAIMKTAGIYLAATTAAVATISLATDGEKPSYNGYNLNDVPEAYRIANCVDSKHSALQCSLNEIRRQNNIVPLSEDLEKIAQTYLPYVEQFRHVRSGSPDNIYLTRDNLPFWDSFVTQAGTEYSIDSDYVRLYFPVEEMNKEEIESNLSKLLPGTQIIIEGITISYEYRTEGAETNTQREYTISGKINGVDDSLYFGIDEFWDGKNPEETGECQTSRYTNLPIFNLPNLLDEDITKLLKIFEQSLPSRN